MRKHIRPSILSLKASTSAVLLCICACLLLAAIPAATQEEDRDIKEVPDFLYQVKKGDTLQALSAKYYGSEHYYRLIMLHNNLEKPEDLKVGEKIRLPEFKVLFDGEPIQDAFAEELDLLLETRRKYLKVEKRLWELHRADWKKRIVDLPEEVKDTLELAACKVSKASEGFRAEKPEVVESPQSLLNQLSSLEANLESLSKGSNDGYGYDLDMVHQRLALALTYGVKWGRNGFR